MAGHRHGFRGAAGALKYEFHVAPAQTRRNPPRLRGRERPRADRGRALNVATPLGALADKPPRSYQRVQGRRVPVQSCYALHGERSYGFALGPYDTPRPLVIDPELAYSTYLGAAGPNSIADVDIGDELEAPT